MSNEFGEFLVPGQKYVPFLVAWKVTCLCVVQYLMVWVFFKCSASVTSFILMIWNSHSLVNIARGCLPQKVWIYSCWRQGWKAGYCSSVFKSCVRPWASATPDAGGTPWAESVPCRIEVYQREKEVTSSFGGKGVSWEGNLPPCAQAHHSGKSWGHSLWQHPQLRDPLLRGISTFLLIFNNFERTWSVWCVPLRQCRAHCMRRRPWPCKVFGLLPAAETGCLLLKVPCVIQVTWSLPKPTCGFHARHVAERG